MKAMMLALTKAGILPSEKFNKEQEIIKAKKETARKERAEKLLAMK